MNPAHQREGNTAEGEKSSTGLCVSSPGTAQSSSINELNAPVRNRSRIMVKLIGFVIVFRQFLSLSAALQTNNAVLRIYFQSKATINTVM